MLMQQGANYLDVHHQVHRMQVCAGRELARPLFTLRFPESWLSLLPRILIILNIFVAESALLWGAGGPCTIYCQAGTRSAEPLVFMLLCAPYRACLKRLTFETV